jgi:predicted ATP-grasp superfamily ATP-dependent carboligase
VRILIYEFASGGGLAGRDVPASLVREGSAMRAALVADLSAIGTHEIVTTADARCAGSLPRGVEVVPLPSGDNERNAMLDSVIADVDAAWLIAPETGGCLEQLAVQVERHGKTLVGSGAAAIAAAANKAQLACRLGEAGVRHPKTRRVAPASHADAAARDIGYPVVVKPICGAGSHGVCLAHDARELRGAVDAARGAGGRGDVLVQEYVRGAAASVSLLSNGRDALALTVNAQTIGWPGSFEYLGGETPFEHPLAPLAVTAALDTCRAVGGLRGFVGVDVVLTETDAVVIEVNPRLTTAYLGVRVAIDENPASLALAACAGDLPAQPQTRRHVRFTAGGAVLVYGAARNLAAGTFA